MKKIEKFLFTQKYLYISAKVDFYLRCQEGKNFNFDAGAYSFEKKDIAYTQQDSMITLIHVEVEWEDDGGKDTVKIWQRDILEQNEYIDYRKLQFLPTINTTEVSGDKTLNDYAIQGVLTTTVLPKTDKDNYAPNIDRKADLKDGDVMILMSGGGDNTTFVDGNGSKHTGGKAELVYTKTQETAQGRTYQWFPVSGATTYELYEGVLFVSSDTTLNITEPIKGVKKIIGVGSTKPTLFIRYGGTSSIPYFISECESIENVNINIRNTNTVASLPRYGCLYKCHNITNCTITGIYNSWAPPLLGCCENIRDCLFSVSIYDCPNNLNVIEDSKYIQNCSLDLEVENPDVKTLTIYPFMRCEFITSASVSASRMMNVWGLVGFNRCMHLKGCYVKNYSNINQNYYTHTFKGGLSGRYFSYVGYSNCRYLEDCESDIYGVNPGIEYKGYFTNSSADWMWSIASAGVSVDITNKITPKVDGITYTGKMKKLGQNGSNYKYELTITSSFANPTDINKIKSQNGLKIEFEDKDGNTYTEMLSPYQSSDVIGFSLCSCIIGGYARVHDSLFGVCYSSCNSISNVGSQSPLIKSPYGKVFYLCERVEECYIDTSYGLVEDNKTHLPGDAFRDCFFVDGCTITQDYSSYFDSGFKNCCFVRGCTCTKQTGSTAYKNSYSGGEEESNYACANTFEGGWNLEE